MSTVARSTIVALASGAPDGGVAVLRLSGPQARRIGTALCGSLPPARELRRRRIETGPSESAEDGLVVFMPGPGSFTGEDVVELHIHGGLLNTESVIQASLQAGAELAEPGAFTRRAFEAGRLSLDEAEGIAATIGAQTRAGLEQARRLSAGELGREVDELRQALQRTLVELEAYLDFPDEVPPGHWGEALNVELRKVRRWLAAFEAGERARRLPRVVLAGPPNAGKSSLLNAVVGRTRALVHDEAGTTRDFLESVSALGGRRVMWVDTAGLRETEHAVEAAGVGLSRDQIAGADVLVWLEAADAPHDPGRPDAAAHVLFVENKRDLPSCENERVGWIGARAGVGQVDAVLQAVGTLLGDPHGGWIGLERHRVRASEAAEALEEAIAGLDGPLEMPAFSLGVAIRRLGEIRGDHRMGAVGADVLEAIFSRFCIGK